jgi:hypothetical protein
VILRGFLEAIIVVGFRIFARLKPFAYSHMLEVFTRDYNDVLRAVSSRERYEVGSLTRWPVAIF